MRHSMRAAVVLCALAILPGASGGAAARQDAPGARPSSATMPVPANVRAEGLPPIPASLAEDLAPYAGSRRALLLGWHPTERRTLIWTTFGNVGQIHSVAGPGMARRQLTFFKEGVPPPSPLSPGAWYAPGGGSFVFARDAGGGAETTQLYRYDAATRQSTLLTDGSSRHGLPVWAHKAGLIAYDSTRRGGHGGADRDLYVMNPANPASARLVAEMDGVWGADAWSPDDRELVVTHAPAQGEQHLWRVDVATGRKTPLTDPAEHAAWRLPQYSADGRFVLALSNRGAEFLRLWRCNLATGVWTLLTADDQALESFALSPDGRTLAIVYDTMEGSRVELRQAQTLALRAAPRLPLGQLIDVPQWRAGSGEVAFTFWSPRVFGDVYSVAAATGAVERWTVSEAGGFDPSWLPEPEIVTWKSFDGLMLSGVLYRPPARFTGPRPVMLSIHGGPAGASARERPRYQGRSAYFLNELGVAILYPNVRGSYGRGKAFSALDDGIKRENAIKDIGALLDWIATQPSLDATRVMATGVSYGGFMTYAVAEAYGNRLRCAFAASAISDFLAYFKTTDTGRVDDRRAEYGDERIPEVRDFLARLSPAAGAAKLRIPLLIAHGQRDSRVPVEQAEAMAAAARASGVPVWLTIYADEGHLLPSTRANNDLLFYTWIRFVQEFLIR
ncbi:MAG: prolyl oligopeptidase family serine peptidase [Acidobacteriota bacterium]